MYTDKERQIHGSSNICNFYFDATLMSTISTYFYGLENTHSEGHPWPPRRNHSYGFDRGGNFGNRKRYLIDAPCVLGSVGMQYGGVYRHYENLKIHAYYGQKQFLKTNMRLLPSVSDMNFYGATGFARAAPTSPPGSLGQFLGELHELPRIVHPRVFKQRAKVFKNIGDQYLNFQFGWVPFVSDVRDLIKNTLNLEKNLKQVIRDNGCPVRRTATLNDKHVTTTQHQGPNFNFGTPVLEGEFYDSFKGSLDITTEEIQQTRFVGQFKYYIDLPKEKRDLTFQERRHLMRVLYGADISPNLLYQLTPWSWLADWFADAGSIVKNFDAALNDNLVAEYAYVTDHKVTKTTYDLYNVSILGHNVAARQTEYDEYKVRTRASPYGFGLDPNSFSMKRLGIMAALGLSKRSSGTFAPV